MRIHGKKAQSLKDVLIMAKRVILRHWTGENNNATYSEWFTAISETASYEQLIYKKNVQMNTEMNTEIWESFLTQIREKKNKMSLTVLI